MSTQLLSRENIEQLIEAVTVNGKLVVENNEDCMKLVRLARAYSKTVKAMINYIIREQPRGRNSIYMYCLG
ncbi:MAG: hypothetical protein QXQ57_07350 [Sulfolobales archaeon]